MEILLGRSVGYGCRKRETPTMNLSSSEVNCCAKLQFSQSKVARVALWSEGCSGAVGYPSAASTRNAIVYNYNARASS